MKPSNMAKIRNIPTIIVQGRYDCICPPQSAYELHNALSNCQLRMIPDAGHSSNEPGTTAELVVATDELRSVQ
jgi:proline iminopeptidase